MKIPTPENARQIPVAETSFQHSEADQSIKTKDKKALYNNRSLLQLRQRCEINVLSKAPVVVSGMPLPWQTRSCISCSSRQNVRLLADISTPFCKKNTKNVNMENLKHELLKHDLQVGDKGRGSRMDGTLIDDGDGALLRLLGYSKRLLTRPQPVISRF